MYVYEAVVYTRGILMQRVNIDFRTGVMLGSKFVHAFICPPQFVRSASLA